MKKALFCILTLACGFMANAGTTLRVVYLNGSDQSYAISTLSKVDFSQAGSASIVDNSGKTLKTESLSSLKMLDFTGTETGVETAETATVKIYPNPTQDALFINGATAGDVIELYNMNGQAVYTGKATDGSNTVSMSSLSNATYILRVGNKVVKIVKE